VWRGHSCPRALLSVWCGPARAKSTAARVHLGVPVEMLGFLRVLGVSAVKSHELADQASCNLPCYIARYIAEASRHGAKIQGQSLLQRQKPSRAHPAEFRFSTDEVYIRRDPQSGDLILSESPAKTWKEIFAASTRLAFPTISWPIATPDRRRSGLR